MKSFFVLTSIFAAVHAANTWPSTIVFPKAGANVAAGKTLNVQIQEPISTSPAAGYGDVAITIGIAACPGSVCPDPSVDMGETLYSGKDDFGGNFTVTIPEGLSGLATIQVGRFYLSSVIYGPTAPILEFKSVQVNVGSGSSTGTSSTYNVHPNGDSSKCVGVLGGSYTNGAAVDIYDCNKSNTQAWQWQGKALVTVNPADKSTWCLDAGLQSEMANGVKMKIWQCVAGGVPQQTWTPVTTSGPIALSVGGFCLDLTNGDKTNKNVLQIWGCSKGNTNQNWSFTSA